MANRLNRDEIVQRLRDLRGEIESEIGRLLKEERILFHYTVERSRVNFEAGVQKLHKRYRINSLRYLLMAPAKHVVTAPLIYSLFFPLVFLDLVVSLYQLACFPIYGIPRVDRGRYLVLDRHRLSYLNSIEKLNCVYCGYGTGILGYAREIAARTEQHWCPIKHARYSAGAHDRQQHFAGYGDAEGYRERLTSLRKEWQNGNSEQTEMGEKPGELKFVPERKRPVMISISRGVSPPQGP